MTKRTFEGLKRSLEEAKRSLFFISRTFEVTKRVLEMETNLFEATKRTLEVISKRLEMEIYLLEIERSLILNNIENEFVSLNRVGIKKSRLDTGFK